MQTNPLVLDAGTHHATPSCHRMAERRVQREAAVVAAKSLDVSFTAYGEELQRVEVFKYLGRLMAQDDNDMQAVRSNLRKARKCWQ